MYCNKCNMGIPDGSEFCRYCGSRQEGINTNNKLGKEISSTQSIGNNNSKQGIRWGTVIVFIAIILFIIFIIGKCITGISNFLFGTGNSTNGSIVSQYNISDEVKIKIKQNWNKISGYGTNGIERVILDIQHGSLFIRYENTERNGLYVTSDGQVNIEYGDGTNRNHKENIYSLLINNNPEEYKVLSRSEFLKLLNEL